MSDKDDMTCVYILIKTLFIIQVIILNRNFQ